MTSKTTPDTLRALWRASLDPAYREPFEKAGDGGGLEVFSQLIAQLSRVADAVYATMGSLFLMPAGSQVAPPASGGARAVVDLVATVGRFDNLPVILSRDLVVYEQETRPSAEGAVAVRTGRDYALTETVVVMGVEDEVVVQARAARPGVGYNNPLPGTISKLDQGGRLFGADLASISYVGGVTAPRRVRLRAPNRPDMPIPSHVGQYYEITSGANAGRRARVAAYVDPDALAPPLSGGSAADFAIDVVLTLDAIPTSFVPGARISRTGWSGDIVAVRGLRIVAETWSGDPSALTVGSTLTEAISGDTATIAFADDARPWIPETNAAEWRVLSWTDDLGLRIYNPAQPSGGKAAMLDALGREVMIARAAGESDDAYRVRIHRSDDLVSPAAILRACVSVLGDEPFCFEEAGSGGLRGIFADVDDHYDDDGYWVTLDTVDIADLGGPVDPNSPVVLVGSLSDEWLRGYPVSIYADGVSRIRVHLATPRTLSPTTPSLFLRVNDTTTPVYAIAPLEEGERGHVVLNAQDYRGWFEVCRAQTRTIPAGLVEGFGWYDSDTLAPDLVSTTDAATNAALQSVIDHARAGGVVGALCDSPCTPETPPPTVYDFGPVAFPVGASRTLGGYGFLGLTSITIGGVAAAFTVVDDRQVTVTAPSGAGSVDLVLTRGASSTTYAGAYSLSAGGGAMVFATQDLAMWWASEDATFAPFNWAPRASLGTSGDRSPFTGLGGYDDPVAGPTYNGHATVAMSGTYPAIDNVDEIGTVLDFDGATYKPFTMAIVFKPQFLTAATLTSGFLSPGSNANVLSFNDYLGLFAGVSGGDTLVGFGTFYGAAYHGTPAVVWPGGAAWGVLLVRADPGAGEGTRTVDVFVNGTLVNTTTMNWSRSTFGYLEAGQIGGGTYPTHQTIALILGWRRRLSDADLAALWLRLKADYPSIPIP